METNSKIYLACYSAGSYDDERVVIVFASPVKSRVTKWVSKFNKMKNRWSDYYGQYCDFRYTFKWIKEDQPEYIYNGWRRIRDINRAYCKEVKIR